MKTPTLYQNYVVVVSRNLKGSQEDFMTEVQRIRDEGFLLSGGVSIAEAKDGSYSLAQALVKD